MNSKKQKGISVMVPVLFLQLFRLLERKDHLIPSSIDLNQNANDKTTPVSRALYNVTGSKLHQSSECFAAVYEQKDTNAIIVWSAQMIYFDSGFFTVKGVGVIFYNGSFEKGHILSYESGFLPSEYLISDALVRTNTPIHFTERIDANYIVHTNGKFYDRHGKWYN